MEFVDFAFYKINNDYLWQNSGSAFFIYEVYEIWHKRLKKKCKTFNKLEFSCYFLKNIFSLQNP